MNWRERIERDPRTLHGKLHVRGTRIPVSVVLDNLAARLDFRQILTIYPSLSEDDVRACVAWAAEISHDKEGASDADLEESPEPGAATEQPAAAAGSAAKRGIGFKEFLRSMPDAGEDADFERSRDYGRPEIEWDT